MPRLLVHRGDALYREVELTDGPLRIGRNPDNDAVLEDVGKAVSRYHAEIRRENGRYVLVDRESQNGVWVSGSRLPHVALEPGVVATIGPYRLTVDSTDLSGVAEEGGTQFPDSRETIVAPPKVAPPEQSVRQRGDEQKKPGEAKPTPGPRPKVADRSAERSKWLLGAIAAVVVGASAVGIWLLVTRGPVPERVVVLDLERPKRLIEGGDCEGALRQLEPVLASNPMERRALELKARAEACIRSVIEPTKPPVAIAEHLTNAVLRLDNGDCAGALTEHINVVLDLEPENAEAAVLKKRAEVCMDSDVKPTSSNRDPLAKPLPPESGGLVPIKGELDKNYLTRVQAMRDRYNEAVSAFSAMEYQKAVTLFEAIVRDAGPKYLDTSDRLAQAKSRQSDGGQKNLQAAREFESKGDWDRALEAYRRARLADPTVNVDADVMRITGQKTAAGKRACEQANVRYGFGRNEEALQFYEDAVKLLPSGDPCVITAEERFPALRK